MDWFTPVDLYCERLTPYFWAEPANAISNIAFLFAALWGWITARKMGPIPRIIKVLLAMSALIGVGSFLFHTFANTWSELTDVIPIWSFVAVYVLSSIYLIGGMPFAKLARISGIVTLAAILTIVFLATTKSPPSGTLVDIQPSLLNGSGQYAPALIALLIFTGLTWYRKHLIAPWVTGATLTFALSLGFRTLDLHLCATFPLGTHFMWHLLNGLMVALLLQALIRAPKQVH